MVKDLFGYEGKRVVITGSASGIGAAATKTLGELNAEIYALDIKEVTLPVKKYIATNLLKKESIDAAVAKLPARIDRIFSCAGVTGIGSPSFSTVDVVTINFLAPRHLIERLLPRMSEGGAIGIIASLMGGVWSANMPTIMKLLETRDFDQGRTWLQGNKDNPQALGGPPELCRAYAFSKECLIAYSKARAFELAAKNIRINTTSPGNTQTAMLEEFNKSFGVETANFILPPHRRVSTPEEQAQPLVFMNSAMASYISGQDLQIDYGFAANCSCGAAPAPGS